jgi:hypothetical protein
LVPAKAGADHLEGDQIAVSLPEHRLAGIDVYRTRYHDFHSLHSGARLDKDTPSEGCKPNDQCFGSGEEEVVWLQNGCEVQVFAAHFGTNKERKVSAVWVSAKGQATAHSNGCATGRGLAIGDSFEKVKLLYGKHFFLQRDDASAKAALFEWKDGTQLEIDMDGNGRVTKLNLDADEE